MYIHVWKNKKRGVISPRTSTLALCVPLKIRLKKKKQGQSRSNTIDEW